MDLEGGPAASAILRDYAATRSVTLAHDKRPARPFEDSDVAIGTTIERKARKSKPFWEIRRAQTTRGQDRDAERDPIAA